MAWDDMLMCIFVITYFKNWVIVILLLLLMYNKTKG